MYQTLTKIRPKTSDSRNNHLFSSLFQQIDSYYEHEEKQRPRTQIRQRVIMPQLSSETYDPTDNLIDRLHPTIQQDAKFVFIKTRERALRNSGQRRKRKLQIYEEPKIIKQPQQNQTTIIPLAPPPKLQKTEHRFYVPKYKVFILVLLICSRE